ncbi:GNAT family N-acetyltransferase [Xylanibacillus composti]|nr:GNAT family N-acetyltransferase [Xylanibacillus composti]
MDSIRTLREDELEDSIQVTATAFHVPLDEEQVNERKRILDPNTIIGLFYQGKLVSKLSLLPLHIWLGGEMFPMGGIASAATLPEHRRKGYFQKLLYHSACEMKEKGMMFSYLMPFSYSYYRKFGWEVIQSFKEFNLCPNDLRHGATLREYVYTRGKLKWHELNPVYEKYAQSFTGMLTRERWWWESYYSFYKKGEVVTVSNADGIQGYLVYDIHQESKTMTIHEIIHLNEEARLSMLDFLANHDSVIDRVILRTPVQDEMSFLLRNPAVSQQIKPGFMGRIMDVRSCLSKYPFIKTGKSFDFIMKITDPFLSWNDGIIRVLVNEDGEVYIMDMTDTDKELDLSCDIGAFTAILFGYQNPLFLKETGRIQASDMLLHFFNEAIPRKIPYAVDYF